MPKRFTLRHGGTVLGDTPGFVAGCLGLCLGWYGVFCWGLVKMPFGMIGVFTKW